MAEYSFGEIRPPVKMKQSQWLVHYLIEMNQYNNKIDINGPSYIGLVMMPFRSIMAY